MSEKEDNLLKGLKGTLKNIKKSSPNAPLKVIFENEKGLVLEKDGEPSKIPAYEAIEKYFGKSKSIKFYIMNDEDQITNSVFLKEEEPKEDEMRKKKEVIEDEEEFFDDSLDEIKDSIKGLTSLVEKQMEMNNVLTKMLIDSQSKNQNPPEKREDDFEKFMKYHSFMSQNNNSKRYDDTFIEKLMNENARLVSEIQKAYRNSNSGNESDDKFKSMMYKYIMDRTSSEQATKDIISLLETPTVNATLSMMAEKFFGAKDVTPALGTGKESDQPAQLPNEDKFKKIEELRKKREI